MSPIRKHKQMALLALLLVLFAVILTQGCGTSQRECENAPDGSKITISPASQTEDTGGIGLFFPITEYWSVRVAYPDSTPMPYACLTIWGNIAVPNGYAAYQFADSGVAVNSPFSAKTDVNGQFTFATILSAGTGTWKDTIYVRSGTNEGSADVEVK